ncbi:MAG: chemotaxis protein CheW [Methylococcaceae bacterium]
MNPLLQQFIQEARDLLQDIGTRLLELETQPDSSELMTELFRYVHTLKGNSGLFEFPEMTRVLHAGEDLMDAVREGQVRYSQALADCLLDAMDFVLQLIDEIEHTGTSASLHASTSDELARSLRALIPPAAPTEDTPATPTADRPELPVLDLAQVPESCRLAAWHATEAGLPLFLIAYRPDENCFYQGEDPFHQARQIPEQLFGTAKARQEWPRLAELDCYRCQLDFHILTTATRQTITEHFRYTPEHIRVTEVEPLHLIIPQGHPNGGPVYGDFVSEALELLDSGDREGLEISARTLLELSAPELWLSSDLRWILAVLETRPDDVAVLRRLIVALDTLTCPDFTDLTPTQEDAAPPPEPTPQTANREQIEQVLAIQRDILALPDQGEWLSGRLKSVATTVKACLQHLGEATDALDATLALSLHTHSAQPLRHWLNVRLEGGVEETETETETKPEAQMETGTGLTEALPEEEALPEMDDFTGFDVTPHLPQEPRINTLREDHANSKVLKVESAKIDRLMSLIGEMIVAKNSLPYLANRAENQYGVRELSRDIKTQYAVINRIAEEMQDAIMQVRMMPISFIFKRFPRLVRDLARKLGKEVDLILEGEDTEADKNIVESLAEPLIHILRNSMDHGLESPAERMAAGKPRTGRLLIRAAQESDRVLIEITDDGRGIDPSVIKRKAYEKGLIDETQLELISDQDAIDLIFTAGFSTAEYVTDLSGRGVGMDVVHNAIDKAGGTVALSSQIGKGTALRLSLPLSMAVTNVMIVESDGQIFGVPMDSIVETLRLPQNAIHTIKHRNTTVLRGRIIPLLALNELLAINAPPLPNADDEIAALVVRVGNEPIGLMVDEFHEVVDVILKPLPGELASLDSYSGSALLGDGSVLMVLNPRALL